MYVKNNLSSKVVTPDVEPCTGIEGVWLQIQSRKLPSVIVGCLYRHPKANNPSYDYLLEVFKQVSLRKKTMYIFGDLNDNLLNNNSKLKKIIEACGLSQLISKPTRVTPQSSTLLDVLITNNKESVVTSDCLPSTIADHDMITSKINISKPKRTKIMKTFRSMANYSKDNFCEALLNRSDYLNSITLTDDVDEQVNILNEVFCSCLDQVAPLITKYIKRPPAPWIDEEIKENIKYRDTLRHKLKSDRHNTQLSKSYKEEKKRVKDKLYKAKMTYYHNKLRVSKGNSSKMWNNIRELVPNNKANNIITEEENNNRAEDFNNFFATVGRETFEKCKKNTTNNNTNSDSAHNTINTRNQNNFRPKPVDIETVILTISKIKETKATGSDGISLNFIKDSLFVTAFYLTCIFNTSIVTGKFPTQWKHAIVVPIFKGGDSNINSNYRPISLLPILSKALEKIVAKQLSDYLEGNALLSNSQHGFRPKLSTKTALTTIANNIYSNIDNKKVTLITLCDLSKAFDSVNHDILLQRCLNVHIDSFWIQDYLSNRTQSTRLNNRLSSKSFVTHGVPQGSILGPILFTTYVNDTSNYINDCVLIQYADDTQFIHSDYINNIDQLISRAKATLSNAKTYFQRSGLMLNSNKTQFIFIGTRQLLSNIPDNLTINIDNNNLPISKSVKILGIHFGKYMTFDTHIDQLNKKVIGVIMFINRIKDMFDKDTRVIVVKTLVLSLINYGLTIWGNTNEALMQRVQKLQNFAAKVAAGGYKRRDRATPVLQNLQWMKMKEKVEYDQCVMVYKVIHNNYPEWLLNFPYVTQLNEIVTRQNRDLLIPRVRTDNGARSLLVCGPRAWNKLPQNIKELSSLTSFKKALTSYAHQGGFA